MTMYIVVAFFVDFRKAKSRISKKMRCFIMQVNVFLEHVLARKNEILDYMKKDQGFRFEGLAVKKKFIASGCGFTMIKSLDCVFSQEIQNLFHIFRETENTSLYTLKAKDSSMRLIHFLDVDNDTNLYLCHHEEKYFFLIGKAIGPDAQPYYWSFVLIDTLEEAFLSKHIFPFALFQIEQEVKEMCSA